MTKRNLLLVSLFLVFGLAAMATSAVAQVSFDVGWGQNSAGRHEGLAEETGVVTLTQTNSAGGYVQAGNSFMITYNAPILNVASVFLACESSTAGDPYPAITTPCPTSGPGALNATLVGTMGVQISFTQTTFFPAITTSTSIIQVVVRVNANAMSGACPQWVTAYGFAQSSGSYSLSVQNPYITNPVMEVNCEPALSLGIAPADKSVPNANGVTGTVLSCIGVKDVASYNNSFCVNVDEEYANALTSFSYEWASDPDATNGTNFTVTLTNVPQGFGFSAPNITYCGSFNASDPNYCSGTTSLAVSAGAPVVGPDSGTPATHTISWTFTVTSEDANKKENMDICFTYWSQGPLPVGLPQVTANVAKGPTLTSPLSIPYFTGVPEYATPLSVIEIYNCDTNLLYPLVSNSMAGAPYAFNNLGTAIFVANTSLDPLQYASNPQEVEGTATPQNGTCTFWLFPSTGGFADATVGTMQTFVSPVIPAGGTYGFDMGTKFTGGTTGYVYAKCQFQNAHGVEYLTDNYALGEPGYAAAFQAIVIPTPEFYHRTPAGDGLGESAIAPLAVNDLVQKLLFNGVLNAP